MTLRRRSTGRGRWLAAISAVIVLIGCVLPWYRAGGTDGIPPLTGNGFEGSGILVFLAALVTLALVSLPFAMGDAPFTADRWWAYLIIAVVAIIGLGGRVLDTLGIDGGLTMMLPDRGLGTWVTAVGVFGLVAATVEMFGSRPV